MRNLILRRLTAAAILAGLMAGTSHAAEEAGYRIGAGDLLRISVYKDPGLSGDFRVGPDGTISYPLLGAVPVADMTPTQIGQHLAGQLGRLVPIGGDPAVQILEYAPVYVVGDVARPGPQPFRPNMIVLELVSLAGGTRLGADAAGKMLQLIAAEDQLNDVRVQKMSLQIQRARLEAEIEGQPFDSTAFAQQDLGSEGQRILADEVALYTVRKEVLAAQQKSLEDQGNSYAQEIRSLEESIRLHDSEVKLMEKEVATAELLMSRGQTTQTRLFDAQRELSNMKRDGLELRSFLARSQQNRLALDQRRIELAAVRDRENAEALREVDLALTRANQSVAARAAAVDQIRLEMNEPAPNTGRARDYRIIRMVEGRRETLPADELSQLQPGDILRIDAIDPARQQAAAPSPSEDPAGQQPRTEGEGRL